MPLTGKQRGLIRVAVAQLGMTDDDYRALLRNVCGVDSSTQLDNFGFDNLVVELVRRGFSRTRPKKGFGNRAGMASEAQIATIRSMWGRFAGSEDAEGLRTWLERTAKATDLRFLDQVAAGKAINGLRAMIARKAAAAG